MSIVKSLILIALIKTLYADDGPPEIDAPFPLLDTTNYKLTFVTDYTDESNGALGTTPDYWDGEIQNINGVNVISTVKCEQMLPNALDNAYFTVEYMLNSLQSSAVLNQLRNHNVYIYHCDPSMQTGIGLYPKQGQYDYVSDLLNYDQSTHDGRAVDQVYGYGGNTGTPTSTCDCNVLGSECNGNAYSSSSILVHEFGHTIMDLGIRLGNPSLYTSLTSSIFAAYRSSVSGAAGSYCGGTAQEMWACGVQTWLIGTRRTDVNPGISTVNDIYSNVRDLYNALYQIFGQSPHFTIPSLKNVDGITSNAYQYYDFHVNMFGSTTLKSSWNTVKGLGTASSSGGSGSTSIATPAPTTTTTTSSDSGSSSGGTLSCGQTVSGSLAAGAKAYHSFTYQGGDVLMYPCYSTRFSNSLQVIDRYWNAKGSDTASSYDACNNQGVKQSTVWADSSYFSIGATYWLVVEGEDTSDYGTYSVTMYCYGAGQDTSELPIDAIIGTKGPSPWSILVIIVLILLVINVFVVYFLVRYCTKKKLEQYSRKQSHMIHENKMAVIPDKEESDEMMIEVDVEIDGATKSITTR